MPRHDRKNSTQRHVLRQRVESPWGCKRVTTTREKEREREGEREGEMRSIRTVVSVCKSTFIVRFKQREYKKKTHFNAYKIINYQTHKNFPRFIFFFSSCVPHGEGSKKIATAYSEKKCARYPRRDWVTLPLTLRAISAPDICMSRFVIEKG